MPRTYPPAVEPSDAELLSAHAAGDPAAFGVLAERNFSRLWGIAMRTLGHPDDAADAVQEGLVSAMCRAHTYRGEASVGTWLARIVVNRCIDRLRAHRPTVPLADRDMPRPDPAGAVATRMAVDEALLALPVDQRLAIVLVDVQGWPVADAATMLGVPAGTVKSRCARGRARLAVLLGHLKEDR
jgi:RNA polymerase sigma-70 factor, ECF subfamily